MNLVLLHKATELRGKGVRPTANNRKLSFWRVFEFSQRPSCHTNTHWLIPTAHMVARSLTAQLTFGNVAYTQNL